MEFILELLLDIFFEGTEEIAKSRTAPAALRVAAVAVFSAVSLAFVGLIAFLTVLLAAAGQYVFTVITGVIGAVFAFFAVKKIVTFIRSRA